MAMINCPECGKSISDRAEICPSCGFPISKERNKGKIRIKLGLTTGTYGTKAVKVKITSGGSTIWEGKSGSVASFEINERINVNVKYYMGGFGWSYGGECSGTIDPDESSKYEVSAVKKAFGSSVLNLHSVDVIDSD